MCGYAHTKIRDEYVDLELGYLENNLTIGKTIFDQDDQTKESEKEMINKLNSFYKHELIEMILNFVRNGEEG